DRLRTDPRGAAGTGDAGDAAPPGGDERLDVADVGRARQRLRRGGRRRRGPRHRRHRPRPSLLRG
ncbi:MAG: Enoyl-CoA hydratase, partial [uncultured Acidimicrobiales bacterium]